jgi:undecaprenyl-diphosphatase
MQSALKIDSPRHWPAIMMMVAGLLLFGAVAADVVFQGQLKRWDVPIQSELHKGGWWPLVLFCSAFSGLGELAIIVGIALVVGAVLWKKGYWRTLVFFVAALLGSGVINPVLKNLFGLPRPTAFTYYVFKPNPGYTFPSGHTMAVAITAGALALVWMHHVAMPAWKRWAIGVGVVMISVMEAWSLMYIGVHYLTDVLAALGVSLAWLGVVRWWLPVRRNSEFRVQSEG